LPIRERGGGLKKAAKLPAAKLPAAILPIEFLDR